MDYKKIFAIKAQNEKRILKINPKIPRRSGIYFLTREEGGFKFAYIGQSNNLLRRLSEHLSGYQHIDLSLKKHGFYSSENPSGYKLSFIECSEEVLDSEEQKYIKIYANSGYQLRNYTTGSQGEGKKSLSGGRPQRTYQQGVAAGYNKARKEIKHLFDLHLDFGTKRHPPTKLQEKAFAKFENFLKEGSENE